MGFEIMFFAFYFLFIAVFIFIIVQMISGWHKNNKAPRLSVDATVVSKQTHTHHHHHDHHHSTTHSYSVTFQVESGDRMELTVPRTEYGLLAEGDFGVLSFQGTRFLGFERK